MRNEKKRRIIRHLLAGTCSTKYGLAKAAGASIAWVMELLKQLEDLGFVRGVTVVNGRLLIREYLRSRKPPAYFEVFLQDPETFFRAARLPYALTTYAAENLTSHTLFLTRWDVYIRPAHRMAWARAARKQGLLGKGNVRFLLDHEHAIREARTLTGFRIVSEPQLLIDLTAEGGVCEAAARRLQHVRHP